MSGNILIRLPAFDRDEDDLHTYSKARLIDPAGHDFVPRPAGDSQEQRCRLLGLAVIERAFLDARWDGAEYNTHKDYAAKHNERAEAFVWLRGHSRHFPAVCALAGVEPDVVVAAARKEFGDRLYADHIPIDFASAKALIATRRAGSRNQRS